MYRLCHLSDPHVSADDPGTVRRFEVLVACARRHRADHLLVTGDVVERPGLAHLRAVQSVLVRHGYWSAGRATVLPGNHDASGHPGEASTPAERRRALRTFLEVFRPVVGTLAPGRPLRKRLGPVELFAVVTASVDHPIEGRWQPGDLTFLEALPRPRRRPPPWRLLALHHQPWSTPVGFVPRFGRVVPEGLRDGELLLRAARAAGVHLVLHGHVHAAGGPFDRTVLGIAIRCQGTAKGVERPGGGREAGYDLHFFGAGRRMLHRRWVCVAELEAGDTHLSSGGATSVPRFLPTW